LQQQPLPPQQPQQQPGPLLPAQQQQQQQQLPGGRLRPSRLDFGLMLAQLAGWQQRHLSAHVPHHCFDAPALGAWVRHMRKQHRSGLLERWKVDRCVCVCVCAALWCFARVVVPRASVQSRNTLTHCAHC
jgi:hypothetical protein